MNSVGIIANPASGKDIRRIVTYSSAYDNQEKVNIIRRVIMALHATGIRRVYYMPEYYNIVPQALSGMHGGHKQVLAQMEFVPLEFAFMEREEDSVIASGLMRDAGVGCLITLGGDGTNRAVAKSCGSVPLVPISTGTNNVFPTMVEGTTAGLAAGFIAMGGDGGQAGVFERRKRLEIYIDGELADIALIDMVVLEEAHIGARAVWSADHIRRIFVTQCAPDSIGISSIAGQLRTISPAEPVGMALDLSDHGASLYAAIAPGVIAPVTVRRAQVISAGERLALGSEPCMVAVDGERNLSIPPGKQVHVQLSPHGPVVVNVHKALAAAAEQEFFMKRRGQRDAIFAETL